MPRWSTAPSAVTRPATAGGGLYIAGGTATLTNTSSPAITPTSLAPSPAPQSDRHRRLGRSERRNRRQHRRRGKPRTGPAGIYGGPTQTMALFPAARPSAREPAAGSRPTSAACRSTARSTSAPSRCKPARSSSTRPPTAAAARPAQLDLRGAVGLADVLPGSHTITFDPTVFATPQTITLTGGQLELSDTTGTETITGPAAGVTVSGGGREPGVPGRRECHGVDLGTDHHRRQRAGRRRPVQHTARSR